jgi:hypothetical protein
VDGNQLQEHLDSRFDGLDRKLERVEAKLDNHLERLSRAEASIEWLKGNVRIVTTIILTVAGFLAAALFNYVIGK